MIFTLNFIIYILPYVNIGLERRQSFEVEVSQRFICKFIFVIKNFKFCWNETKYLRLKTVRTVNINTAAVRWMIFVIMGKIFGYWQQLSLKCSLKSTIQHGITPQKTPVLILISLYYYIRKDDITLQIKIQNTKHSINFLCL
jgi:hypothetical protein